MVYNLTSLVKFFIRNVAPKENRGGFASHRQRIATQARHGQYREFGGGMP
jgi:hypothetical protein